MRRRSVVFIALVAILLIIGLAAPAGAGRTRVGVAYDSPLGDLSFNDITHAGVVAAQADLPIEVREMDPFSPRGFFIGNDKVVETLASRGDLVITVGFLYADAVTASAGMHPGVDFVALDNVVDLPNVASVLFAANEGSFLVGAAAAMTSEADTVGFIGGVDIPVVLEFEAGYVAGVHHIAPDTEVLVEYVSYLPDFSGFGDPVRAYEIAMDMFAAGADVVFHAAGASGLGLFFAADHYSAANEHVWAIGVDADQYLTVEPSLQEHILTSMLKRLDVATYDMIEAEVNGTFSGGIHLYDLASNGVGYSTSGGFIDAIVPDLEMLKAAIIDGTIVVPSTP